MVTGKIPGSCFKYERVKNNKIHDPMRFQAQIQVLRVLQCENFFATLHTNRRIESLIDRTGKLRLLLLVCLPTFHRPIL